MLKEFLECGKIINKRGTNGELKVMCLCDGADALKGVKKLYTAPDGSVSHDVISIKEYRGFIYVKFADIASAEAADALRGQSIYAKRGDIRLGKDRIFIEDIIGLDVLDADSGTFYGKLAEVFNRGASDIYRVEKDGKEYFIPAVKEFIVRIESDKGIFVRPIPGMFDGAEEIK